MVKKVVLVLLAILAVAFVAILGIAATKPDVMVVERSATIEAPPEIIYPYIANLNSFGKWSPWEEKDPNMERKFSGPESGKGAAYEWNGNDDVGQGRMEITSVEEPTKIVMSLHFIKPFEGDNDVVYTLSPTDSGTKVNWMMKGESPFMCKIMQVFMNMEEMCGKDFEKGLAKLKTLAEADSKSETDNKTENQESKSDDTKSESQ